MLKLFICDLNDTLVNHTEAHQYALETLVANVASKEHIPRQKVEDAYTKAKQRFFDMFPGMFPRQDKLLMTKGMCEKLGITDSSRIWHYYQVYKREYLYRIRLFDDAKVLFEYCKNKGIPLILMTNDVLHFQMEVIAELGISQHFTDVFTSNEFFKEKPFTNSLLHIIQKYHVEPRSVCVIGDSRSDMEWGAHVNTFTYMCVRRGDSWPLEAFVSQLP